MDKGIQQPSLKSLAGEIREGGQRAEAMLYLYLREAAFPNIEKYLRARGAGREDARDVCQDAFLVMIKVIRNGKFQLNAISLRSSSDQLSAYLMGVAKNIWKKELRWRKRDKVLTEETAETTLCVDLLSALIQDQFRSMSEACQSVLTLYFKEKLSPRVIAGRTGEKTESIKKQLSGCVSRLLRDTGHFLEEGQQAQLLELMRQGLEDLEDRCATILRLFYFEKKSMSELAEELGYASAHSVTEQKHRCMARLNMAVANRIMNG